METALHPPRRQGFVDTPGNFIANHHRSEHVDARRPQLLSQSNRRGRNDGTDMRDAS
jgi:hypothetical protein